MDNGTHIQAGTVVVGTVRGKGPLTVAGRIDGKVFIDGDVRIAARAAVTSDIEADVVEVRGLVKGNIKARQQVVVDAGAQVEGTIEGARIEIDPAARVKGRLVMPLQLPRGVRGPTPARDAWST